MHVEAFSEGKDLDRPELNEDQFLILPGRGFAVIDGVTDRTGHCYEGLLAGRMAAGIVQQAVASFLLDPAERADPARLVRHVTGAIRAAYERFGMLATAEQAPERRFGATLAFCADLGETLRFVLVGDSGLRLNGAETIVNDTGLDLVTASLRQEAWRVVREAGGDGEACAAVGRACAFDGAARLLPDMRPWLDETALASLLARTLERCRQRFPDVAEADLRLLLEGGIRRGQVHFQNNRRSLLSYAVLDGFEVPMELVSVMERAKSEVATVELFTDGYFLPGAQPAVAAWEQAFAEVEATDPEKVDRFPSVKGTMGRIRADDRTVVIVRF
ncbi:protein phosphatase 2C domain-containing protein [Geminicoccaceae bacterium 1502E]|nr:protein phosphatase 2C domain-containing protein [Geminicoccaceae bacterium 1502E]